MKLTRFGQSGILVETKNKRILVDPSTYYYEDSLLENEWNKIDLILVTHKHSDHCNSEAIKKIVERDNCKFYTTSEVANANPDLSPEIIKIRDVINLGDIKIEVVKAIHSFIPSFKGDKETPENVGYILDNGDKRVYFVGDSICFDNDYLCNIIFIPICNHGIVMGPFEAGHFAKKTGAELVIPYHYDSPNYPGDLEKVKEEFNKQKLNYKILDLKETIEID